MRAVAAASLGITLLAGCTRTSAPETGSRQALGTAVTVSAWGSDRDALRSGIDGAFGEMSGVAGELDAYSATSAIAPINENPYEWHKLPPSAVEILDRVPELGVQEEFSATLWSVTRLYGFGGKTSVPTTGQLDTVLLAARRLERDGSRARFGHVGVDELAAIPGFLTHTDWTPGLDFGGAAKGLALDRALARLQRSAGIEGAMISAGSSTAVWGRKTDGESWRVGIEDPRATGTVLAVVTVEGTGTINVSTSGDYQQFFERDGVRYHHILDPATGRPARGLRSLTVFGDLSGLDADILSTALFVMGRDRALSYARAHGLGLYLVADDGAAAHLSPRKTTGASLEVLASPQR